MLFIVEFVLKDYFHAVWPLIFNEKVLFLFIMQANLPALATAEKLQALKLSF